jgi:ubiquitin C-terminal hydrolase
VKGVKFTKFPKVLILHLKRFDLNLQTMTRHKLNDKVTFPLVLNMNPFHSPGSVATQYYEVGLQSQP